MTDLTRGILGGLGTGVTWAAISILVRSLSGTIAPAGITAVRSTVGGAIVLLAAVATGYGGEVIRMPLWVVLSLWASIVLAMGIGDTIFFASMDHLGVTRALTLSMANPLLTTVVGIGFLGEEATLPRAAGILLVVGGLCLVVSGKGEAGAERRGATRRGVRLVFLAAGVWALSAVILKPALQVVSVVAAAAVRIPLGGFILWLTPWTRGTVQAVRKSTRAERGRLGAICLLSAVGSVLFTSGIKFGGVAVGNVLASTSPLFTLPFEVWVLGQRPSRRTALGAVVTVLGIGLMHL
ncbi:MAG: DMT family transporter [candidate division NC10 bacterium]|nr:DMT family transporter [candidate division NC10 bacterium]